VSHKAIRLLIEDTVKALQDDIDYTYGRETDFNQKEKKMFTFVNTSPLVAVPAYRSDNGTHNYMKAWSVEMVFLKICKGTPEKYIEVLDEMDGLVDSFLNRLNFFESQSDQLIIQSINQQPAINVMADILTGYVLTFQMVVNDNFEYCVDCP
jgi:hypothetical protein